MYQKVCNRGAFVARRAPIEGARPIPYSMVPNFLGQLNLTPQHPNVRYDFRCCPQLVLDIWSISI